MVLLCLDSKQSMNNRFKLDNMIEGIYKLVSFVATNNIYNITDYNNKIYWNENGTDKISTLTNGFYDSSDFTTHLSSVLNTDGSGTISVSLDDNTRKFTITDTLTFYFTFGSNTSNSARKLLGYDSVDGTTATSQISTNPIDLNTCKNIYINILQDDNKKLEGINFFTSSLVINGDGNTGETLRYIDSNNFDQYIKLKKTKQISLSFHDIDNNSISLNSEYQLILKHII